LANAGFPPGYSGFWILDFGLGLSFAVRATRGNGRLVALAGLIEPAYAEGRMELVEIQVESYAGHMADETPRRFKLETAWTEIDEVVDRWYQVESLPEWPRANYFKVRDTTQREHLLKHDLEIDQWFLCRSRRGVQESA
jgi:hypothetical protein